MNDKCPICRRDETLTHTYANAAVCEECYSLVHTLVASQRHGYTSAETDLVRAARERCEKAAHVKITAAIERARELWKVK